MSEISTEPEAFGERVALVASTAELLGEENLAGEADFRGEDDDEEGEDDLHDGCDGEPNDGDDDSEDGEEIEDEAQPPSSKCSKPANAIGKVRDTSKSKPPTFIPQNRF